MKTSLALAWTTIPLLAAQSAFAQSGSVMDRGMMDGGNWGMGWTGAYGGLWVPALLLVAVIGLVAWSVKQRRK
jgi:hypothetical protein